MKIAFSVKSHEPTLHAAIDPRFGRARYFFIVDSEKGNITKVLDNSQAYNMTHGAGIKCATAMVDEGVDAVASGFVGPKAFSVLQAAGIKVYSGLEGTVKEALAQITAGKISPDNSPSSDGHW